MMRIRNENISACRLSSGKMSDIITVPHILKDYPKCYQQEAVQVRAARGCPGASSKRLSSDPVILCPGRLPKCERQEGISIF